MQFVLIGLLLLALGAVLLALGWRVHRSVITDRPPGVVGWASASVKHTAHRMVARESTMGERLAGAGAVLVLVGLLVALWGALTRGATT